MQEGESEIEARRERGRILMEQITGSAEVTSQQYGELSQAYVEWVLEFALGQVWSRPALDLRTRSLCTVAALTALGRHTSLRTHVRGALGNGASREEVIEAILHMAVYSGFPAALDGLAAAREVFAGLDADPSDPLARPATI